MQLRLLCHPGWLAKRCDEFAGARNELRRVSDPLSAVVTVPKVGAMPLRAIDRVLPRDLAGPFLAPGEQGRADARASPVGLDAQDLDVRRRGVVVEFPLHLDEADQPIGVERADRGVAREVGPAQVLQHLLGPASQVGGAQCLDVEAPQERGVGAQLGVIGRAGVVGESDRTDLDAHDRSSPGRRQPPRLARAQRRRQGSIGR